MRGDAVDMTGFLIVAAVISLLSVLAWIGLLIWGAIGDGRVQKEHERRERR